MREGRVAPCAGVPHDERADDGEVPREVEDVREDGCGFAVEHGGGLPALAEGVHDPLVVVLVEWRGRCVGG